MPKDLDWYQKSPEEIYGELDSSKSGLTTTKAGARLKIYKENLLPKERPRVAFFLLLDQFKNPLIYILLAAAVVTAFYLRDTVDSLVILAAVFVNTLIGFFQEYKASRAIEALKEILASKAIAARDGIRQEIEARWLVPGDIIFLRPGHRVPADARLFEAHNLKVNEASLTGESLPVKKEAVALKKEVTLAQRRNTVFSGTEVSDGVGIAIVVATGLQTEVGKISRLLSKTREEKTPLQKKLLGLSHTIAIFFGLICLTIFLIGYLLGHSFTQMFTLAVALSVAAIPEGLVVTLTVILALGMQRIFREKALVRKLLAAETLGSVTTICTDKTGTLTLGKMQVSRWEMSDLALSVHAAALCNDLANQTDLALWEKVAALKDLNFDPQKMRESIPRFASASFSSATKFMATLHPWNSREVEIIFAKGAPEVILSWCKLEVGEKERLEKKVAAWAEEGVRVLAFAYKLISAPEICDQKNHKDGYQRDGRVALLEKEKKEHKEILFESLESGFTFLGLAGISDPIRPNVKGALSLCKRAGIRVVVVTGDHRETAMAVMGELGLEISLEQTMFGEELADLSEAGLDERIEGISLFARTSPSDKLKIVQSLKRKGEVVAMTGDGVNDTPALKQADIGIAVFEATEVAKETSDMVLLDSNFGAIVAAVKEGRLIFENMKKVITFLLTGGFTEVVLVGGSIILGLPIPVTAAQILWINLIEDGLPAMALAFEEEEEDVMKDPPRSSKTPLLDGEMKILIFVVGILTDFALLATYFVFRENIVHVDHLRTVMFVALGIDSLFNAFCFRSLRKNIWKVGIFGNKPLLASIILGYILLLVAVYSPFFQKILKTQPLTAKEYLILFSIGFFNLVAIEVGKWYHIRRSKIKS